ncbi:hypothetical protein [Bradyrhizobium prioriisuperbiae]|uniref:hypothetical protein n=1 Tax=Bradyrhizobium prioriisuperbiae TaxID=2854389 RepID=UPI0028ECF2F9|nr:hypothetical protein [Bradyrhizobium prioritasuperba]
MPLALFIDDLAAAANTASRAEDEFRRTISARIKALETERAFAFRRLNLMREVADAVTASDDEAMAVAQVVAALRARLGWASDSDARREVVERFVPVAKVMFEQHTAEQADGTATDTAGAAETKAAVTDVSVTEALAAFEAWYAATHPVPFWVLFENVMPETPVVDF